MILKPTLLAVAAVVSGVGAVDGERQLRHKVDRERHLRHTVDRELSIKIENGMGAWCLELLDGCTEDGSRVILGDCCNKGDGFDYQACGDFVQLYSRKDSTMCLQADELQDGAYLRLRECGDNRFQLFEWEDSIVPADDPSLCVTYQGQHPDVGDYIKLKKCSRTTGDSWDYVEPSNEERETDDIM
jgi:hypothetical protein